LQVGTVAEQQKRQRQGQRALLLRQVQYQQERHDGNRKIVNKNNFNEYGFQQEYCRRKKKKRKQQRITVIQKLFP